MWSFLFLFLLALSRAEELGTGGSCRYKAKKDLAAQLDVHMYENISILSRYYFEILFLKDPFMLSQSHQSVARRKQGSCGAHI